MPSGMAPYYVSVVAGARSVRAGLPVSVLSAADSMAPAMCLAWALNTLEMGVVAPSSEV